MAPDKDVLAAIRAVELELGRIMRRQSGLMDMLREIRGLVHDVQNELKKADRHAKELKHTVVEHDRWERETK